MASSEVRGVGLKVIGVDFGTSAVRGAVCAGPETVVLRTPDGAGEVPACVSFAAGGPHVGFRALSFATMQPHDSVREIKRWLLSAGIDDVPAHLLSGGPAVVSGEDGGIELLAGGAPRPLAELVTVLVQRVIELAPSEPGEPAPTAVFAHPLTPNASLDAALRHAASVLGLRSVAFIAEPLAAAVALCGGEHARPVLIADVGASHATVAVVEVGDGIEPRLLHAASAPVGGDSVTFELVQRVTGKDVRAWPAGMGELLRQYCEQLKHDLASVETAQCALPPMFVQALGLPPELSANRAVLQDASAALLHTVEDVCARALGGAGLSHSDLELHVIGGAARSPLVTTLIERCLGTRARVSHASGVIALGAAKHGGDKPPTRAVDDVRTRASWRPQPKLGNQPSATSFVGRPASAPPSDVLRIPNARVPVIVGATPVPEVGPPPSTPPSRPPSQPIDTRVASSRPPVAKPISQPVIHVRAPSQPVAAGASQRPSAAPRLSIHSITPQQIDSGHVHNATTPAEVLQLPIARPLRDSDLEPITLPLLLLLTGSKRRTGTLVLRMDGALPLRIGFVEGKAAVSPSELTAVGDRMKLAAGSYQFDEGRPEIGTRQLQSAVSVVVAGLRQLMRAFVEGDMRSALADKLDLVAEVTASDQLRMGSLSLTPLEQRAVKFSLNGKNTGHSIIEHSGIGPHTALSLLMLLEVYGFLTWREGIEQVDPSLSHQLEARAKALEAANFFQVLSVHWSATGVEIGDAFRKMKEQLGESQPVYAAAPEACRRMLARAELAYQTLSIQERRDAYRKKTFPDINFKGVEDLLEKKQRALELKDSGIDQAREVQARRQEIASRRSKKPPPA